MSMLGYPDHLGQSPQQYQAHPMDWRCIRRHILTEALSWHQRFLDAGDMRV